MSLAATSRRALAIEPPATVRSAPRLFEPGSNPSDGSTLEDLILGAWEELIGRGSAECPVCSGRLQFETGCGSCGSELS